MTRQTVNPYLSNPVGMRVRYYRQLLRLDQAFVAEHLGITRPGYNKRENGKQEFLADDLTKLANIFRVHVEDLFHYAKIENQIVL